jgi:hypothetical protein
MFFSKEIDFYYLNFTWKLNKLNKIIHVINQIKLFMYTKKKLINMIWHKNWKNTDGMRKTAWHNKVWLYFVYCI